MSQKRACFNKVVRKYINVALMEKLFEFCVSFQELQKQNVK